MNILICSIVRDNGQTLNNYFNQIVNLIKLCPNDNFYISIFENDSKDNSKEIIKTINYKGIFKNGFIRCQDLNLPRYGSVAEENRVKLLSSYRNETLNQIGSLDKYDKIIWIEPDCFYVPEEMVRLIYSNYDIYSGMSLRCNYESLSKLNFNINRWLEELDSKPFNDWLHGCRDGWATRIKPEHLVIPISGEEYSNYFRGSITEDIEFYSTYNGFCVYNANGFKNGARFGYINEKYNRFDCDTYIICDNFHKLGYNKVFLNKNIKILHIE